MSSLDEKGIADDVEGTAPKEAESPSSKFRRFWQENFVLPKLLIFVFNGGNALVMPFLPLFYRAWQMDTTQIGILTAVPPFVMFIASSAWSMLADATGHHRRVLMLTVSATTVILGALPFIPPLFPVLFVMTFLYAVFRSPNYPLLDTWVLTTLGSERSLYGRQRMFGGMLAASLPV